MFWVKLVVCGSFLVCLVYVVWRQSTYLLVYSSISRISCVSAGGAQEVPGVFCYIYFLFLGLSHFFSFAVPAVVVIARRGQPSLSLVTAKSGV